MIVATFCVAVLIVIIAGIVAGLTGLPFLVAFLLVLAVIGILMAIFA